MLDEGFGCGPGDKLLCTVFPAVEHLIHFINKPFTNHIRYAGSQEHLKVFRSVGQQNPLELKIPCLMNLALLDTFSPVVFNSIQTYIGTNTTLCL